MIKFLHAADLHLDTTFSGGGAERRQEQRQMVTELLELADAQTCDLVLLAGDLFEGENVYPETRAALRRALATYKRDITTLIVTQRCSTIKSADWILVLSDGRLAGQGTHDELFERCDTYRDICLSQLNETEVAK